MVWIVPSGLEGKRPGAGKADRGAQGSELVDVDVQGCRTTVVGQAVTVEYGVFVWY